MDENLKQQNTSNPNQFPTVQPPETVQPLPISQDQKTEVYIPPSEQTPPITQKDNSSKYLLLIALVLFILSIVGLSFYIFSAYKEGRLISTTPIPTPEKTKILETPVVTVTPSAEVIDTSIATPSATPLSRLSPSSLPTSFEDFSQMLR